MSVNHTADNEIPITIEKLFEHYVNLDQREKEQRTEVELGYWLNDVWLRMQRSCKLLPSLYYFHLAVEKENK